MYSPAYGPTFLHTHLSSYMYIPLCDWEASPGLLPFGSWYQPEQFSPPSPAYVRHNTELNFGQHVQEYYSLTLDPLLGQQSSLGQWRVDHHAPEYSQSDSYMAGEISQEPPGHWTAAAKEIWDGWMDGWMDGCMLPPLHATWDILMPRPHAWVWGVFPHSHLHSCGSDTAISCRKLRWGGCQFTELDHLSSSDGLAQ